MNDAPTTQAKRVAFYVDGYNLYHSINNIVKNNPGLNYLKWLDLRKLFSNFLVSGQEELVDIFFYTAEPTHTKPDVQNRYRALLDAYQRFLNIRAVYGKFKAKPASCKQCRATWWRHEEKESDVNLALGIVQAAYERQYDKVYIVTQDSDMAPAVALAERVCPGLVHLLTPPAIRHSHEISRILGGRTSQIQLVHLQHSLMPACFLDKTGAVAVRRPVEYTPPTNPLP